MLFDFYGVFDIFDFFDDMFGFASSSTSAPAAPTQAAAAAAPPASTGKDKLEARLLALLMNAGVKEATLNTLGEKEVYTVTLYANLASTAEKFRSILEGAELDIKGDTLAGNLEQSRLISVWKSLQTTIEVEDKHAAERLALKLPPQIHQKDIIVMKKLFEKSPEGFEVAKCLCPSKSYFQRKTAEIRGGLRSRAPHDGHD